METANQFLTEHFLPAFNAEFKVPAREAGSAFVPLLETRLDAILCIQEQRTVNHDNCVRFNNRVLQLPKDQHRCHYVKAKVRVHVYPTGQYAVFHGPRKLADYDASGQLLTHRPKADAA